MTETDSRDEHFERIERYLRRSRFDCLALEIDGRALRLTRDTREMASGARVIAMEWTERQILDALRFIEQSGYDEVRLETEGFRLHVRKIGAPAALDESRSAAGGTSADEFRTGSAASTSSR